jgi:hypothetical protein
VVKLYRNHEEKRRVLVLILAHSCIQVFGRTRLYRCEAE